MNADPDWTDADLAIAQSLDAAGASVDDIARQLGRESSAVEDKLPIVRARHHTIPIPDPAPKAKNDWLGPDEEGDVVPTTGRDDPAAWVHDTPKG